MVDAFGHELHIDDFVYFCALDYPNGTYRSPCKMYRGVIVKLTDFYATIEVHNAYDKYLVKKSWNKIGFIKHLGKEF